MDHLLLPLQRARRLLLLPIALLPILPPVLTAQEELPPFPPPTPVISTDRPGQGTPPGLMVPGVPQFELAAQVAWEGLGEGSPLLTTTSLPLSLLRVGVFERMELRVSTELRSLSPSSAAGGGDAIGLAGIGFGAKLGIAPQQGAIPELSALVTMTAPIGEEAFRPAHIAPSFLLLARSGLDERFALVSNLGIAWNGGDAVPTGLYTFAVTAALTSKLGAFAEIYGAMSPPGPPAHAVDAGLSLLLGSVVQLDLSGGLGLSAPAVDAFVNVGLSFRNVR